MLDRRRITRRWEDEPWTRGEQQAFEHELASRMGLQADELAKLRRVVERFLGILALVAFLAPILTALIIAWGGRS